MSITIDELSSNLQTLALSCDFNKNGKINAGREMRAYQEAKGSKSASVENNKSSSQEDSLTEFSCLKNTEPKTYIPKKSTAVSNFTDFTNLNTSITDAAATTNYTQSSPVITATSGNYTDVSNTNGFSTKYDSKILTYANKYNLDPNLVKAVIMAESSFNPNATSDCDCRGLMQVNPKYHSGNLYDVDINLDTGCQILNECLEAFGGDVNKALMGYNQGVGGAKSSLRNGTTSTGYSRKVLSYWDDLKSA